MATKKGIGFWAVLALVAYGLWRMFAGTSGLKLPGGPGGKGLTVPAALVEAIRNGKANPADVLALGQPAADLIASESWLYGFQAVKTGTPVPDAQGAMNLGNAILSKTHPGWNSVPAGATPVIDGEGPKKAWIAQLWADKLGANKRPGVFPSIPGL